MNLKRLSSQSGFSLMEITIVVVILGFVAGLSLIKFENNVERMRATGAINILKTLREAEEVYRQENGAYTSTITALGVSIPGTQFFGAPTVSSTGAPLAQITRTAANFRFGTPYTLSISSTGAIACSGGTFCPSLGF